MKEADDDTALNLFSQLLMVDEAADWLKGQPDHVTSNSTRLIEAFKQRFAMNDIHRRRQAKLTWQRQQRSEESVDGGAQGGQS